MRCPPRAAVSDDDVMRSPAAELEDRIMSLSVCRSGAVTVSEGVLKQQLSQARSEAEILRQEVARLKEELEKERQANAAKLLPMSREAGEMLAEVMWPSSPVSTQEGKDARSR